MTASKENLKTFGELVERFRLFNPTKEQWAKFNAKIAEELAR